MNKDEQKFYALISDAREECGGAWRSDTLENLLKKLGEALMFLHGRDVDIPYKKLYSPMITQASNILFNSQKDELRGRLDADIILCDILNEMKGKYLKKTLAFRV